MLVLLGEVGGVEEYRVCEALKSGRINKPMVAWCIGTCGDMFTTDVQVKINETYKDSLNRSNVKCRPSGNNCTMMSISASLGTLPRRARNE